MKLAAETPSLLPAIAARIAHHAPGEGATTTAVRGLTLLRADEPTVVQRGLLQPSVCVVVQGRKIAHAGADMVLRYGAGDFLATAIDMPLAGQVLGATRAKPFLAILFDLTPLDVLSVLRDAKIHLDTTAPPVPVTFVGASDERLLDVVLRSVRSLDDEREAHFLAPALRRELIFRLVTGPSAFAVIQSARLARVEDGLGRAVDWLRTHFKEPLDIAALARLATMSTSTLHHRFKAAMRMGPLQYQKRLRLEEARRLLLSGLADATSAALDVGYESPSQFSREYRRQFGLPPLRDVKRMQHELGATEP